MTTITLSKSDSGARTWRGWKVSPKSKGTYYVEHLEQGVYFYARTLAVARERLLAYDDAVVAGDVPAGCHKNDIRDEHDKEKARLEFMALPDEEREAAALEELDWVLTHARSYHQRYISKFLSTQEKNPLDAFVRFGPRYIMATIIQDEVQRLLDLPIEERRDGCAQMLERVRREMTANRVVNEYGSPFEFAVQVSILRANSELIDNLVSALRMYDRRLDGAS